MNNADQYGICIVIGYLWLSDFGKFAEASGARAFFGLLDNPRDEMKSSSAVWPANKMKNEKSLNFAFRMKINCADCCWFFEESLADSKIDRKSSRSFMLYWSMRNCSCWLTAISRTRCEIARIQLPLGDISREMSNQNSMNLRIIKVVEFDANLASSASHEW